MFGNIQSFNFVKGQYLSSQAYRICFRQVAWQYWSMWDHSVIDHYTGARVLRHHLYRLAGLQPRPFRASDQQFRENDNCGQLQDSFCGNSTGRNSKKIHIKHFKLISKSREATPDKWTVKPRGTAEATLTLPTRQQGMDKLHVGLNNIFGNGAGDLLDNLSFITVIFQLYRFHLIYLCFLTPLPSPRTSLRPQVRE